MASPLNAVSIAAPAFYGLNTQESGITLGSGFALTATNCVIDKFGRIGSRKGWSKVTDTTSGLASKDIRAIASHIETDGTETILFATDNKLWRLEQGNTAPEELTAADTAITSNTGDWQIISFNNKAVFVQQDETMVYYDGSSATYNSFDVESDDSDDSPAGSSTPSCGCAAFGRVWVADDYTVYWSKSLDPIDFQGTGTGSLNIREVFGEDDKIVAITQHNNYLVIFGRRNIALYSGASANIAEQFGLHDHIKGVGCIARDTVQSIGTDVLFLSETGLRGLGRTIQERSVAVRDLSKNVRDELVTFVGGETESRIKAVYSPYDAFYLLTLPGTGYTYCFDMRAFLQDGSARVTVWDNITPTAFAVKNDGTLLLGKEAYLGKYGTYADDGTAYRMKYYTNYFDFDQPTIEKLLKKIRVAMIGGAAQAASVKWATDYSTDYRASAFKLSDGSSSEYGEDEYFSDDDIDNEAEYSTGIVLDNISINIGGKGTVLQLGIEADITTNSLSIQKIDIFVKTGKLLT